jgi:hypothetical protein
MVVSTGVRETEQYRRNFVVVAAGAVSVGVAALALFARVKADTFVWTPTGLLWLSGMLLQALVYGGLAAFVRLPSAIPKPSKAIRAAAWIPAVIFVVLSTGRHSFGAEVKNVFPAVDLLAATSLPVLVNTIAAVAAVQGCIARTWGWIPSTKSPTTPSVLLEYRNAVTRWSNLIATVLVLAMLSTVVLRAAVTDWCAIQGAGVESCTRSKDVFPVQLVLLYGMLGSGLVAISMLPAQWHHRKLLDDWLRSANLPSGADAESTAGWLELRAKLEAGLAFNLGRLEGVKSVTTILSPLAAGLLGVALNDIMLHE